jgi:hypothetical protein
VQRPESVSGSEPWISHYFAGGARAGGAAGALGVTYAAAGALSQRWRRHVGSRILPVEQLKSLPSGRDHVRLSHHDREQCVALLREHGSTGRLDSDEPQRQGGSCASRAHLGRRQGGDF